MPQIYDMGHGFTSPPKEGVLRIFIRNICERNRIGASDLHRLAHNSELEQELGCYVGRAMNMW